MISANNQPIAQLPIIPIAPKMSMLPPRLRPLPESASGDAGGPPPSAPYGPSWHVSHRQASFTPSRARRNSAKRSNSSPFVSTTVAPARGEVPDVTLDPLCNIDSLGPGLTGPCHWERIGKRRAGSRFDAGDPQWTERRASMMFIRDALHQFRPTDGDLPRDVACASGPWHRLAR